MKESGFGLIYGNYSPGVCLEGLRKVTKYLIQHGRSPDQHLNPSSPEYKAGILTIRKYRWTSWTDMFLLRSYHGSLTFLQWLRLTSNNRMVNKQTKLESRLCRSNISWPNLRLAYCHVQILSYSLVTCLNFFGKVNRHVRTPRRLFYFSELIGSLCSDTGFCPSKSGLYKKIGLLQVS